MSPSLRMMTSPRTLPIVLFIVHVAVMLATVAPTVHSYHLDSAEFVIGAHTLGIVHSPGYPLYLLIAKLFTWLPFGTVAFRVNLFSAVALAASTPLIYLALHNLVKKPAFAAAATMATMLSFHVWQMGVSAEVYAPQLLTLALTAWLLTREKNTPLHWLALSYGLALAINPASVLFAPGVAVIALSWRRSPWSYARGAAIGVGVVVLPLLYFPLRYSAGVPYSAAGYIDGNGTFISLPLDTVQGVWQMIRGVQFRDLYFYHGVVPSPVQLQDIFLVVGSNLYWLGFAVALVGLVAMWDTARRQLAMWAVFYLPFIYFYTTYGAIDRTTMLGPGHALLALPLAHGLAALLDDMPQHIQKTILSVAVAFLLAFNFTIFTAQRTDNGYATAAHRMENLPPDAVVLGPWQQIVNMQYIQLVEGERDDLTLYNMFLFQNETFAQYITETAPGIETPVIFLQPSGNTPTQTALLEDSVQFTPIHAAGEIIGYRVEF